MHGAEAAGEKVRGKLDGSWILRTEDGKGWREEVKGRGGGKRVPFKTCMAFNRTSPI